MVLIGKISHLLLLSILELDYFNNLNLIDLIVCVNKELHHQSSILSLSIRRLKYALDIITRQVIANIKT